MKYFQKSDKEGFNWVVFDEFGSKLRIHFKTFEDMVRNYPKAKYWTVPPLYPL